MSSVNKFVLNDTTIDVEDAIARATASSVSASVQTLQGEVDAIKELSRLTVSYSESNSTITFTNNTH